MTVGRADLSVRLSVERMAPVSLASAVEGQSSAENGEAKAEGKPRRRPPPPPEEVSGEPAEADGEQTQHRIDSLA